MTVVVENEYVAPVFTPRRRRTGVCPNLRMDGAEVDYPELTDAGMRLPSGGNGYVGGVEQLAASHTFTCAVRSTIERIRGGVHG